MFIKIASAVCLALAGFVSPIGIIGRAHAETATTQGTQPIEEVRTTIDQVVKAVGEFSGDSHREKRRVRLREIINPVFDFNEMAKRSLGARWKELTPEEQGDFVKVFSDLLAKTYLARIETVKPGMVS